MLVVFRHFDWSIQPLYTIIVMYFLWKRTNSPFTKICVYFSRWRMRHGQIYTCFRHKSSVIFNNFQTEISRVQNLKVEKITKNSVRTKYKHLLRIYHQYTKLWPMASDRLPLFSGCWYLYAIFVGLKVRNIFYYKNVVPLKDCIWWSTNRFDIV